MPFVEEKPENCPVCYEKIDSNELLNCGHYVHKECIMKSRNNNCPICRKPIPINDLFKKELNICLYFLISIFLIINIIGIFKVYQTSPSIYDYFNCVDTHEKNKRECNFKLQNREITEKLETGEYTIVNGLEYKIYRNRTYTKNVLSITFKNLNFTEDFHGKNEYPYDRFINYKGDNKYEFNGIKNFTGKCYIKDQKLYFQYNCENFFKNVLFFFFIEMLAIFFLILLIAFCAINI